MKALEIIVLLLITLGVLIYCALRRSGLDSDAEAKRDAIRSRTPAGDIIPPARMERMREEWGEAFNAD